MIDRSDMRCRQFQTARWNWFNFAT